MKKHTKDYAKHITYYSKQLADKRISSVTNYVADNNMKARLAKIECKSCFYLKTGRVGGAAMTQWFCGICGEEQRASSTNHDTICSACAKKHSLCKYCGGDIDLNEDRKKYDF